MTYFEHQFQNVVIAVVDDISPFYSFGLVIFLFAGEYVIHEILLQLFIGYVDKKLVEAILFKVLKSW